LNSVFTISFGKNVPKFWHIDEESTYSMRPGQPNKRMRGRNNNRKNTNALNRSYDSNGPDNMRIRGTASHVADKYVALSRDATASGDTILAESYLQHAEHYNRIVSSAQAAMQQNNANRQDNDYNNKDNSSDSENNEHPINGTVADPEAPQPDMRSKNSEDDDNNREDGRRPRRNRRYTPRDTSEKRSDNENTDNNETTEIASKATPEEEAKPKRRPRGRPRKTEAPIENVDAE
jgi:hypothetical protein